MSPTKPVQSFTAWSYSRLGDYRQCPLKAKLKHIDRLKEPGSAAMDRGSLMHAAAAAYLKGRDENGKTVRTLHPDLKLFKEEFTGLRKEHKKHNSLLVEKQWAFTSEWAGCDWFARNTWCRMVLDLGRLVPPAKRGGSIDTMQIVDYKTGKVRAEEQKPQLSLYAVGGFALYPDIQTIDSEFWYLDAGEVVKETYTRDQYTALKKQWQKEVVPMFKDRKFAARPTDKCRWCHFRKANNGPCKF